MNSNSLEGTTDKLGGKLKETIGGAIGDKAMQSEGVAQHASGTLQKTVGDAIEAVEDGIRPLIDQVRQFSRDRPFATAAVVGVLGLALINTLRGK